MTEQQFKDRTRTFALDMIRFVSGLERNVVCDHIGRQALRCSTSVAANYRAACRARSKAEMISRLGTVEEEADEAVFWLDLLKSSEFASGPVVTGLEKEADELLRMIVASSRTLKGVPRTTPIQNPKSKIQN